MIINLAYYAMANETDNIKVGMVIEWTAKCKILAALFAYAYKGYIITITIIDITWSFVFFFECL